MDNLLAAGKLIIDNWELLLVTSEQLAVIS